MSRAARFIPASSKNALNPYVVISRLGGYYNLKYYKNTDYFIPITPDIGTYLMGQGIAPDRIQQINNFAEVEAPRMHFNRADYGVPPDATLLVSLGRLHTSKAFDTLMKAMQKVPDTYAFIAGAGPDEDALKNLASQLGIADRITFMGWIDDRAALLRRGIFVFSHHGMNPLEPCLFRHGRRGFPWSHHCRMVRANMCGMEMMH
jgi:glycosyltransferase involved in cell wall biosynthesis